MGNEWWTSTTTRESRSAPSVQTAVDASSSMQLLDSVGDVVVSALKVLLCLGEATVKLLTCIVPSERLRITFQMECLVRKSLDRLVRPPT